MEMKIYGAWGLLTTVESEEFYGDQRAWVWRRNEGPGQKRWGFSKSKSMWKRGNWVIPSIVKSDQIESTKTSLLYHKARK